MMPKFVVQKLPPEDSRLRSTGAERTRGPYPKPGRDGVKSTLKLYPPSDGALPHPNYSVLLLQKNKAHSTAFVLYESDSGQDATAQRDDALKQFAVIHKTLKPLIEDGVLMLSTHLLNMLNFEDTELTESELRDVIEGDEAEDEETTPQEEDDSTAGTIEASLRAVEDAGGVLSKWDMIMKKSPNLAAAFKGNDYEYYPRLMEDGDRLSKPVDGSGDDSNYLHVAAEVDVKKARGHKFITSASHYIFKVIQRQPSEKSDHDRRQIEDFSKALNAPNAEGLTPLMLAVKEKHFESALALLLAGADPDIADQDGNTALHHAAQLGSLELVRLLVVFFANLDDVDTLLKMAGESDGKDAFLCVELLLETKKAAASNPSGTLESISIPDIPDDPTFLLALDGGSIKGVITIQILLHLARRMKEIQDGDETLHTSGDPVCLQSYFDYMAGTSAGSWTALALRYCNNVTLEFIRATIFKLVEEVMSEGPTFCSEQTEQSLKETFGEDTIMMSSKSEKQRVIIPTVLGDKDPPVLHLMCNYDRPLPEEPKERRKPISSKSKGEEIPPSPKVKEITSEVDGMFSDQRKVWEAARASSAAPYYFDPFKERLIDGGVMANNPTLDSMAEILRQGEWEGKRVKIGLVLSIGTGIPIAKHLEHVGVHRPCGAGSILKSLAKGYSSFRGLVNLFHQFCSQSTQSDGQEVERANAWCKAMGAHYVRLSPELSRDYDFGETDSVILTELMYEGHIYALEQREKIDQVARLLLKRKP